MKVLRAFIKPFQAPQRSVKIKIQVISLRSGSEREGLTILSQKVPYLLFARVMNLPLQSHKIQSVELSSFKAVITQKPVN